MSSKRPPPGNGVIDLVAEKARRQSATSTSNNDVEDVDTEFVFDSEETSDGKVNFEVAGQSLSMVYEEARELGLDFIAEADGAEARFREAHVCSVCGSKELICGCLALHMSMPGGGVVCGADALCTTKHADFVSCKKCLDVLEKKL